jgi:hypothetical protein
MKISKDLIEKYHRNECSTAEAEAVENWLFSADTDEALQLPLGENKSSHKADIWNEISTILPEEPASSAPVTVKKSVFRNAFWSGAVAATLVIGIVALAMYQLTASHEEQKDQLVSLTNTSSVNVKHIESQGYNLSVGTNTSASIDNLTGVIDLAGSILISPKKDLKLTFEGSTEKITLKKGQTYIILRGKNGKDKLIIVSEKNLMDLPPVLQKQIINEFNI